MASEDKTDIADTETLVVEQTDGGVSDFVHGPNSDSQGVLGALPDPITLLDRLTKIRDSKRNVLDLIDKLKVGGNEINREMLQKLVNAYDGFKEQENQYLQILEKVMALKYAQANQPADGNSVNGESGDAADEHSSGAEERDGRSSNFQQRQRFELTSAHAELVNSTSANQETLERQRALLLRMQKQQEQLKALQEQEEAARGLEESTERPQNVIVEDLEVAAADVDDPLLEAKQRQLAVLREKLDHLKRIYAQVNGGDEADAESMVQEALSASYPSAESSSQQRRPLGASMGPPALQRLQELQAKKEKMDALLNELNVLQREDSAMAQDLAAPDEESEADEPTAQERASYQAKLLELSAAQERLTRLKGLLTKIEHAGGSLQTGALPADLVHLVQEIEQAEEEEERREDEEDDLVAFSQHMKSEYKRKLTEQQDAVQRLSMERERLAAIQQQMEELRHSVAAERPARTARHGTVERPHSLPPRPPTAPSRLQDSSGSDSSRHCKRLAPAVPPLEGMADSAGGATIWAASSLPETSDEERDGQPRQGSYRLAASYRRETGTKPNLGSMTSARSELRRPQEVETPPVGAEYFALQQHMESIKDIFQRVVMDQQTHIQRPMTAPAYVPALPLQQQPDLAASLAASLQQQQLLMSLLSCQQQLQMQHMEIGRLQHMYQDLAQERMSSRAGSRDAEYSRRSSVAGYGGGAGSGQMPPVHTVTEPQQFDGRPLSSASLYNLFCPNPYLPNPQPYYSMAAGVPTSLPSPRTQQQASKSRNLSGSLNNSSHSLNNQHAPPVAKSASHSHVNLVYANNTFAPPGEHGGGACVVIEEDTRTRVKTVDDDAGTKTGGNSQTSARHVPKLELDDLYKSNVARKQKNFKQSPQLSERVSATSARHSLAAASQPTAGASNAFALNNQMPVIGDHQLNFSINGDQFEAMRESIYAEVATFISQNEARPQFLVEVFKELQLLSSDYLRTRALHAVRELLNSYLTQEREQAIAIAEDEQHSAADSTRSDENNVVATGDQGWALAQLVESASESALSEDEPLHARSFASRPNAVPPMSSRDKAHDYSEAASSASSLSTPENVKRPFADDALAETMVSFSLDRSPVHHQYKGSVSARDYHCANLEEKAPIPNKYASLTARPQKGNDAAAVAQLALNNANPVARPRPVIERIDNKDVVSDAQDKPVDVGGLEQQIREIVDELIPFLRENAGQTCTPQLLAYMRKLILTLATQKCTPSDAMSEFFHRQLSTILDQTLAKFAGQSLGTTVAEELVSDVNDVVFNELAFFRVMNVDGTPRSAEQARLQQQQPERSSTPVADAFGIGMASANENSDNDGDDAEEEEESSSEEEAGSDPEGQTVASVDGPASSGSRRLNSKSVLLQTPLTVELTAPSDDECCSKETTVSMASDPSSQYNTASGLDSKETSPGYEDLDRDIDEDLTPVEDEGSEAEMRVCLQVEPHPEDQLTMSMNQPSSPQHFSGEARGPEPAFVSSVVVGPQD